MMVPLRMILSPGEIVQLRLRRPLWGILFRVGLHSLPPLALFAAVGLSQDALDRITERANLLPGFWKLIAGLAVLLLLTILPGYALTSLFSFDHWHVAVTERRVLVRHGGRNIRRDEMMRHDIEACLYDRAEGRIVLFGDGRALAIACNQREAGRILAALGYDEAGA